MTSLNDLKNGQTMKEDNITGNNDFIPHVEDLGDPIPERRRKGSILMGAGIETLGRKNIGEREEVSIDQIAPKEEKDPDEGNLIKDILEKPDSEFEKYKKEKTREYLKFMKNSMDIAAAEGKTMISKEDYDALARGEITEDELQEKIEQEEREFNEAYQEAMREEYLEKEEEVEENARDVEEYGENVKLTKSVDYEEEFDIYGDRLTSAAEAGMRERLFNEGKENTEVQTYDEETEEDTESDIDDDIEESDNEEEIIVENEFKFDDEEEVVDQVEEEVSEEPEYDYDDPIPDISENEEKYDDELDFSVTEEVVEEPEEETESENIDIETDEMEDEDEFAEEESENEVEEKVSEDEDDITEEEADRQYKVLQNNITEKIRPIAAAKNVSGFTIVSKQKGSVSNIIVSKPIHTAKWCLPASGCTFTMKEFTGGDLEYLFSLREDSRSLLEHVYNKIASPTGTFEQWVKSIAATDLDHLFFGIYLASFNKANFMVATCKNKDCKTDTFITDDIPMQKLIKFKDDEKKNKFKELMSLEPAKKTDIVSEVVPISNDYAIGFKVPTLYSEIIEPTYYDEEFVKKHAVSVSISKYIDEIYKINWSNKQLTPVGYKEYVNNSKKTFKSKIITYSKIIATLTTDEFSTLKAIAENLANSISEPLFTYRVPEIACPDCGKVIEEQETDAFTLVFSRAQLSLLQNTSYISQR